MGLPLVGAAQTAAPIIAKHPEYHELLTRPDDSLTDDYGVDGGVMNPFLHLSLHLAVAEQVAIDQPPSITAIYHELTASSDPHTAEHVIIDCLGEQLWRAGQGLPIDNRAYLEALQLRLPDHVRNRLQ